MCCFTMNFNMGETMKTVSGPRWGCLYPVYMCWDAIIGATNTVLTPDNEMSCPQVSLYDVSESTQNVLFHDEHEYGGNVENLLRTSVRVFISFVYIQVCTRRTPKNEYASFHKYRTPKTKKTVYTRVKHPNRK